MNKEYRTSSPEETEALGRALGERLLGRERSFVAFFGELGVGKTAFTRGIAAAVGYTKPVKSPTYTILNEYRGGKRDLFHFDLYRIEDEDDLWSVGFWDRLDESGIVICEWSERIPYDIPADAISVLIEKTDDAQGRKITIGGIEIEYPGT